MKHAYLILAHGQWELLRTLISCIDDRRNDIYVHIDAKVKDLPELSTTNAGLTMVKDRVDARWGDVSIVEAEYTLLEAVQSSQEKYDRLHILSGVDLPLKSQDYIHEFFDSHPGVEFIAFSEPCPGALTIRKVMRWHLFPRSFKSKSWVIRGLRAVFLIIQEMLGIYRNKGIEFRKGSNWASITPELADILISRKEWALKTFTHTFCSDEIYIQTICWNSPLRERIYNTEDDAKGCLRAIGWRDGCLYDWAAGDFESLRESEALFARKFNLSDRGFIRRIVGLSLPSTKSLASNPAVSIIIPVYNAADTLPRSLASLKAQTFRDFEVIFIDDCSTDSSAAILEEFARTSSLPCRILRQDRNRGVAAARNAGLEAARGEFVAWLDADDELAPQALEKAVDAARPLAPGQATDIVGFDWRLGFETNSRYMRQADWSTPPEALKALCGGTARWNLWLFLLRREFVENEGLRFTEGANMGEDMAFIIKAFTRAASATQIHEALYLYNAVNSSSISKTFSEERRREIDANVAAVESILGSSEYADEIAPYIDHLKLYLKRPLLVSGNKSDYLLWTSWMPEANGSAFGNKALPLRTRLLQWMASKRLWTCARAYYIFVYKFVYGVIYR